MTLLEPQSPSGWITAIIAGHWVQAKVYDEPSTCGVGGYGRVSKLATSKTDSIDSTKPFFPQICFNYDRGLDFDRAPADLVSTVVAELETIPVPCAPIIDL